MIKELNKGELFDGWKVRSYEDEMLDKINEIIEEVNELRELVTPSVN